MSKCLFYVAYLTCLSSFISQDGYRVAFMNELRMLFALMLSSKRKYVDPTKAVQVSFITKCLKIEHKKHILQAMNVQVCCLGG